MRILMRMEKSGIRASKRARVSSTIKDIVGKPSHGLPGRVGVDKNPDTSGQRILRSSRDIRKSQIRQVTEKPKLSSAKHALRVKKASAKIIGNVEVQSKQGQESSDRFGGQCIGHGDENTLASTLQVAEDHCNSGCGVRARPQGHDIKQQKEQLIVPQARSVSQDLELLQSEPQECGQETAANSGTIEKEAEKGLEEGRSPACLRDSVAGPMGEQSHPGSHPGKKKSGSGSTKHSTRGDKRETNGSRYTRKRQNAAKVRWKCLASSILHAKSSTNPVSISETLAESQSLSSENHLSLGQNFANETDQIRNAESSHSHAIELQPRKRRRTAIARKKFTEAKTQKVQKLNVMESQSPSSDNPRYLENNFANRSEQIRSAESGDSQATELRHKSSRKVSTASAKRNMQQVQKQQVRIFSRMKTFLTKAKCLQVGVVVLLVSYGSQRKTLQL